MLLPGKMGIFYGYVSWKEGMYFHRVSLDQKYRESVDGGLPIWEIHTNADLGRWSGSGWFFFVCQQMITLTKTRDTQERQTSFPRWQIATWEPKPWHNFRTIIDLFFRNIRMNQHLQRGANLTLRDGEVTPFRSHLAPLWRCWKKRLWWLWRLKFFVVVVVTQETNLDILVCHSKSQVYVDDS